MEAVAKVEAPGLRRFEDFYAIEYPRVFKAVYLLCGDREAAHDATQEAFERAYSRWRRLAREPWAAGWVVTTAVNISRRSWRASREDPAGAPPAGAHPGPSTARVDVIDALRKLPLRQRLTIFLYYLEDLPLPAIAESMGITEGAVKAHLAQARAALRKRLEVKND